MNYNFRSGVEVKMKQVSERNMKISLQCQTLTWSKNVMSSKQTLVRIFLCVDNIDDKNNNKNMLLTHGRTPSLTFFCCFIFFVVADRFK